jgi:ABC-type Na+ efflux pump permease subunit
MTTAPRVPPRPTFVGSTLRIFDSSLGQMLWSRRSVFLAVLVGGPVLLAVLVRIVHAATPAWRIWLNGAELGGAVIFGMMIWIVYVRFIVPILGVFYGTALIADEVDDKTITYLFARPIRRGSILAGKYLAYLACTLLLVLPSVVLVYFLIVPLGGGSLGGAFPQLIGDLATLALGLIAYGAVFAFIGARLKRPLVVGLLLTLGLEPAVLAFPGYLKRVTVAYYLEGLIPHPMPNDSSLASLLQTVRNTPAVPVSVTCLLLITAIALALGVRAVENREYVLEQ